MTGQGRERDTCRFDISSPIWALPDKAWKECGKGVSLTKGGWFVFSLRTSLRFSSASLLQKRLAGPRKIDSRFFLVFPRALCTFIDLHFYFSSYRRRRILGGLVAFICLSIKQDIDFSTISPFIFVCLFYPCEILYIARVCGILMKYSLFHFLKITCNACLEIK